MALDLKSRLLLLVLVGAIAGLFVAVRATSDRESPYAPIASFAGCYSNATNQMMLGTKGEIRVNGTAAGSYQILKPVGGKHGFLVEADGLALAGGGRTPVKVARGESGFFWPINGETLEMIFPPDVAITLRKSAAWSC